MTDLRVPVCIGTLSLALAACSSSVTGDPAYVAPTSVSSSDRPSASPTVDRTKMCTVVPSEELERIFGAPVETTDRGQQETPACGYQSGAKYLVAGHFPIATVEEMSAGRHPSTLRIGGHPANKLDDGTLVVATGPSRSHRGVLVAYAQDIPELQASAIGLLEALLRYYEY